MEELNENANKSLYLISGFWSESDKEADVSIYKLVKLGAKKIGYGWIDIENYYSSGIGTATDDRFLSPTIEDAMISALNVVAKEKILLVKCTLEEVIEIKKNLLHELIKQ